MAFFIANLLFCDGIERQILNELRNQFCLAFDTYYQADAHKNIALSLLGLALVNAYEGHKRETLTGFKFHLIMMLG